MRTISPSTTNAQCSGRCPGVCTTWISTEPTRTTSPSSTGSNGYSGSASGWIETGTPCSSARRPCPETWSACVCVSSTRTIRTPAAAAASRYCSIANAGSTTTASPASAVADEVRAAPEIVVDELPEEHAPTLLKGRRGSSPGPRRRSRRCARPCAPASRTRARRARGAPGPRSCSVRDRPPVEAEERAALRQVLRHRLAGRVAMVAEASAEVGDDGPRPRERTGRERLQVQALQESGSTRSSPRFASPSGRLGGAPPGPA